VGKLAEELLNKYDTILREHPLLGLFMSSDERTLDWMFQPDGEEGAVKCPRCYLWHRVTLNYDNLCDRCCATLIKYFPNNDAVEHIRDAYAKQRERFKRELHHPA